MTNRNTLGRYPRVYLPYYDIGSDFNTNAGSYYDYLAKINYTLQLLLEDINNQAINNLEVKDSISINMKLLKKVSEGFTTTILESNVNLSESIQYMQLLNKMYKLDNAIEELSDGLYVKDYTEVINDIVLKINDILRRLSELEEKIKGLEDRIKTLEENGGGSTPEPDIEYLGDYKEYDFEYVKGNTKTVRVELGAASTSDTLGDTGTETAEDVGHIVYNIPSGFILDNFRINFSKGFLKLGNLQAKNFKIHLINNDKTNLTLRMGEGFINGKVQAIMKEDGTFYDHKNFCTLLSGTTTTIHGTVYTNPDGEILRTYAKYTVTQGVGV